MAITNAQQYKSMLVKKRKDGKRPGYYGPDAGHENDPGTGNNSGNNGGDNTNRERGIMSRGKGPKGTTGNIGDFEDTGPDRSAVGQFSTYGKNVMNQNLKSLQPSFLDKAKAFYNKLPTPINLIRNIVTKFGPKTGFSTQGAPYGNAPGGIHDYSSTDDDDDTGGGEGDNRYVGDPCRGPNPPAYCFVGIRSQASNTTDPVVDTDPAIPYRLMNMGGDTEDAPLMAGAPELKLQGDVQPKQENMMMAEVDPFLMEEYEKYVFDMEEMGLQPMTFEEFRREAMSGMASGGIAGLRQGYFLGGITRSIKKAVKGATRAVKKIAKSKVGKAALLAAGGYYLGGGNLLGLQRTGMSGFSFGNLPGASFFGKGIPASVKSKAAAAGLSPREFMMGMGGKEKAASGFLSNLFSGMSTGKKAALGIGALTALPLLGIGTGEEEEREQDRGEGLDIAGIRRNPYFAMQRSGNPYRLMAEGGNAEPVAKDVMPLLDMDGKEKDYRETGGFVDMGRMEKADDVPARLSKNEFVFTADAVRNAGEGDIDKGAEVMYNMMKNLESGGEVSEDSQGLDGAKAMFQTSQKLEGVL
jgi:hypothetical protein